jgi:hypothetical protein
MYAYMPFYAVPRSPALRDSPTESLLDERTTAISIAFGMVVTGTANVEN